MSVLNVNGSVNKVVVTISGGELSITQTKGPLRVTFNDDSSAVQKGETVVITVNEGFVSKPSSSGGSYSATLIGSGAIAQGPGAVAVGQNGRYEGGSPRKSAPSGVVQLSLPAGVELKIIKFGGEVVFEKDYTGIVQTTVGQ